MRKPLSLGAIVAGLILTAIALTGCSGSGSPSPSATASLGATATAGGVKDPSGKCVDGMSSPTMSNKTITLADCDAFDIMGDENIITAGTTKQLSIEGSNNTITIDTATRVTTLGEHNTILYTGDEPQFTELGTGNRMMPKSAAK